MRYALIKIGIPIKVAKRSLTLIYLSEIKLFVSLKILVFNFFLYLINSFVQINYLISKYLGTNPSINHMMKKSK